LGKAAGSLLTRCEAMAADSCKCPGLQQLPSLHNLGRHGGITLHEIRLHLNP
jgi:hypothetical protein